MTGADGDKDGRPEGAAVEDPPLRLPDTDWLHHKLTVSGPVETVTAFAAAARGAGTIPWALDLARIEEDLFLKLVAPEPPRQRSLSLVGARALARQLCEAVAERHEAAMAQVGWSRACPFDLHALLPVPPEILALGPEHPDADRWLWAHWGTTDALRRVVVEPAPAPRGLQPAPVGTLRRSVWSADWTPWRAFAVLAERWPTLRFDLRPSYDPT